MFIENNTDQSQSLYVDLSEITEHTTTAVHIDHITDTIYTGYVNKSINI